MYCIVHSRPIKKIQGEEDRGEDKLNLDRFHISGLALFFFKEKRRRKDGQLFPSSFFRKAKATIACTKAKQK